MSRIPDDLLTELVTLTNELTCAKETVARIQGSDLLVMNHVENGSTSEELIEPLNHLFEMSAKKPYYDVEYSPLQPLKHGANILRKREDVNIYDLDTFLRAIVPWQTTLTRRIEEQCNIYPQFQPLVERLSLLDSRCENPLCYGSILAESIFSVDEKALLSFAVAHPPYVYELDSILHKQDSERLVEAYLAQLQKYLKVSKLENESCLLCLTLALYSTDKRDLPENFALFFLENGSPISRDHDTLDLLYETHIENYTKNDQCSAFDDVLHRIRIVDMKHDGQNEAKYFLRYDDGKKVRLFF